MKTKNYLKFKIIILVAAIVFLNQSNIYRQESFSKAALRNPSSFSRNKNEPTGNIRYLRAMFQAARENPLMQVLEGIYQTTIYGELHDSFWKTRLLPSYAIIKRGIKPIANRLYHDEAIVRQFDKVYADLHNAAPLPWLGEGSNFLAFTSPDPNVAVKYIKVYGSLEVLANIFPPGHKWSQDYGVDDKGRGELHYALWEHIRSFELYGDRAALCKIYIADDAYKRLSILHKHLLKRFIDIGIVQRINKPIEIMPAYPDFIPQEKRTEIADGKVKVSVLVLQSRLTHIKDKFVELLNNGKLKEARALVDEYLDFVHNCMADGVFLMDLSMNNVGIQKDSESLKVFDAVHLPLNFSTGRPRLGNFSTESEVLEAAGYSSREVLRRVEQEVADAKAKALANIVQGHFEEKNQRMIHAARHFEPNIVSNTALIQKEYIFKHPVFLLIRDVLNGNFTNQGFDMPLDVSQHNGAPSCIQAGLKEYNGRPLIIAINPTSQNTLHNKEWGRIKLPGVLAIDINKAYWFVDLITGEEYNYSGKNLLSQGLSVGLSPYRVHPLLLHRIEDTQNMTLSYNDILEKAHVPWVIFIDYDGTIQDFGVLEHDPELTDIINDILKIRKTKIVLVTARKISEPDKIREIEEYFIERIRPELRGDLDLCYGFYGEEDGQVQELPNHVFIPLEANRNSKFSAIDFDLNRLQIGPGHAWFIADDFKGNERSVVGMAKRGFMLISVKKDQEPVEGVYYYNTNNSKGTKEILKAALELVTRNTTAASKIKPANITATQL